MEGVVSVLSRRSTVTHLEQHNICISHVTRWSLLAGTKANKICFDVSLTLSLILHKRTDDRANKTGE